MHKQALITLVGGLVIIAGLVWWFTPRPMPTDVVSNQDDSTIRAMVAEFGTKLQLVSLMSPTASAEIATHYSTYLSPELLAQWQQDPSSALGRRTSSPWPDRIEVVEVVSTGGPYVVNANIIEVSNDGTETQPFAVQPVNLTVEQREGRFVITHVESEAYSQLPQRQSVVGFWECLPKKGPGPHTMECAFGIALDQSDGHMAVNTQLMSQAPVDYPVGTKVRIDGVVTSADQLSAVQWQSYDIDGIISATSIQIVE